MNNTEFYSPLQKNADNYRARARELAGLPPLEEKKKPTKEEKIARKIAKLERKNQRKVEKLRKKAEKKK